MHGIEVLLLFEACRDSAHKYCLEELVFTGDYLLDSQPCMLLFLREAKRKSDAEPRLATGAC